MRALIIILAVVTFCIPSIAQNTMSDPSISYVANTRPPDAYLSLRTHPTSSSGQRIMTMPNGTKLQVLQRQGDGWWYVRVLPSGQEGWALSGQGNRTWIVAATANQNNSAKGEDRICRGILTINATEQSSGGTADNGSRLIRADNINESCLFDKGDKAGRAILSTCRMGYPCEVRARVNGDESDVYYVLDVYSVRSLQ